VRVKLANAICPLSVACSLGSESVEFWILARSKSNLMQMTGGIPDSSVRQFCKLEHHTINKAIPSLLQYPYMYLKIAATLNATPRVVCLEHV
jgi:hypothetical protein